MNRKTLTILTTIAAVVAVAAPAYFANMMARKLGLDAESSTSMLYALDAMNRSEETAVQAKVAFDKLASLDDAPCSAAAIRRMREIDLESSYLQAVGYYENEQLLCSSLGINDQFGLALGPLDLMTSNGVGIRKNVKFDLAPDTSFIVLTNSTHAAIIHKELPIDTSTREEGVILGVYTRDDLRELTTNNALRPNWMRAGNGGDSFTFIDDGYLVSVTISNRVLIGGVAAIPLRSLENRTRSFSLLLIPIGLVAGGVLSFLVIQLAKSQSALPSVLKAALRNREFFLAYQPVVDMHSRKMVGAEVLLRWQRRGGEMIRPDVFIPVAEETGLILQITAHAIELLTEDARGIFARYPDFHLAINLSAADCHSDETVNLLLDLAAATRNTQNNLIVEATERSFVDQISASRTLGKLRQNGVLVAIDDFGTGYSSLSMLQNLKIDMLKIDKAFVGVLGTYAPMSDVTKLIIEMSKGMQLPMIAEGVETEEQAEILRSFGVQFAQGWLYGRPQPWPEILKRLAAEAEPRDIS